VATEVISLPAPEFRPEYTLPALIPESDRDSGQNFIKNQALAPPAPELCPALMSQREADKLLAKRSMTAVRRIVDYHHPRNADVRFDALQHLAWLCTKNALGRNAWWSQRPFVRFDLDGRRETTTVGELHRLGNVSKDLQGLPDDLPVLRLAQDPENHDSYQHRKSTHHYFQAAIGEAISRYSPDKMTKTELLALAKIGYQRSLDRPRARKRLKNELLNANEIAALEQACVSTDADHLIYFCNELVCDMIDLANKEARYEIKTEDIDGWRDSLAAPSAPFEMDYQGAIQLYVSNPSLRQALSKVSGRTLEAILRKLDAGIPADKVIGVVAQELRRSEQTIRGHLTDVRHIATGMGAPSSLVNLLADFLLPSPAKEHAAPVKKKDTWSVMVDPGLRQESARYNKRGDEVLSELNLDVSGGMTYAEKEGRYLIKQHSLFPCDRDRSNSAMLYGDWLDKWATRLNTTTAHISNITRKVLPRPDGPPMLAPVPPDMLRREFLISAEFIREAEAEARAVQTQARHRV
jgi:hypothetical protein